MQNKPAVKETPSRDQVPLADTWDLTLLYPSAESWMESFSAVQKSYGDAARFKGKIGESAQSLLECLEFEKALGLRIERLYHYSMLKSSEDSSDAENLKREGLLDNLLTLIAEATSFIQPEIQAIDDAAFEGFLAEPILAPWKIPLRKLRRLKPHTLGASEERLLALGASAIHGHRETFSQLTNVDMKFGSLTDEKGVERPLSQSSFSSFLVKRDPAVRKAAFHQFYAEFQDHRYSLASGAGPFGARGCLPRARAKLPVRAGGGALCRCDPRRRLRQPDLHACARISSRSSVITNCAAGCWACAKSTSTTPTCRWSPNWKATLRSTAAIDKVVAALAPLGRRIRLDAGERPARHAGATATRTRASAAARFRRAATATRRTS